jgi:Flp pilus assembly protein TadG
MSPLFAMTLMVSVLFCGITLDLGLIEFTKLHMQQAADAAALGAQVSHDQEDPNYLSNGVADAGLNGFTNGVNNTTVSLTEAPATGTYAGQYDAVQATITHQLPISFMAGLVGSKKGITVTATALETPCVYILSAHSSVAPTYPLELTSGSSLGFMGGSSMGCPVYVTRGLSVSADSSLWTNATNVTGSAGASSVTGGFYHQPRYGALTQSDPLAYTAACATLSAQCINGNAYGISPPSFSSCNYTNQTWIGATVALNPGTYCNSFNFTGQIVTLSPGLYIITGGATWTNAIVSGSGVTLYFTQGGGSSFGQFKATSTPITLSAPTTSINGGIPTILMMNDPNWVPTSAQDFQFLSGSSSSGDGIYYLNNTGISISSSTFTAADYLCFDVDNMLVTASAVQPRSNFSPVATGNPFTPIGNLVQ